MLIDLSCPVENRGTIVKTNSGTNEPYLLLKLFNLSEKKIVSVKFTVSAFNSTGAELGKIPVELNELLAEPKSFFAENKAISLVDMEEAKHFVVDIENVVFEDETTYEPSQKYTVYAEDKDASIDDAIVLRGYIPEAVCFASEHSSYWRCVCGRPNFPDSEVCVRCEREKSDILEKFSSREKLEKLIENDRIAEEKAAEEELERLMLEKELKKKKTKKVIITASIAIAAAAVLAVAGFFIYRGILNIQANNALKDGDYFKAYELYQKTENDKIREITQHVQGNTPENLMFQSGLIASDKENLYYLVLDNTTYTFNLVKENKETKEKVTLTDAAGGSLNVIGDWIYFIDTEKGYIKRITKDGETIENVIDSPASYLAVVGNTIYFTKKDYDNPTGLTEEQCQTLAAQGQMDIYNRIYKIDVRDVEKQKDKSKLKPKLLFDKSVMSCAIYGDRIYYLTDSLEQWSSYNIHSVDLNGEDEEVIIDVPVASFVIKDNMLYYVKMFNDSHIGKEVQDASGFDYSLYCLDLETGGERNVTSKYMITYMNANEDKLFFIAYDREEYFGAIEQTTETPVTPTTSLLSYNFKDESISTLVAGEVQVFNVYDDDLVMFLSTNGMCRMKADGSGFEELKIGNKDVTTEEIVPEEENVTEE